jgi:hypothetical protein
VIGSDLDRQLGFIHGSPYVLIGRDSVEVFTLDPQAGCVFAQAGVHEGNIVLGHSPTGSNRGCK